MWNIIRLFWGHSEICVHSLRATPSLNKSHILSEAQNNLYLFLSSNKVTEITYNNNGENGNDGSGDGDDESGDDAW